MFKALWKYRHFIVASVRNDLKGRFARSSLGGLWFVLHPLAQALIIATILSHVLSARLPNIESKSAYAIYNIAGTSAWALFAEIINRSQSIFLEQASALKRIAFPRLCLPTIIWGSALLNHMFLLTAVTVVFMVLGTLPGIAWLWLPLGILLISGLAFGIGMLTGVMNVFSRDVSQVMMIIMQLWFWFTPIVYPVAALPEELQKLIQLNPMTPLVQIYQNAMLLDRMPNLHALAYPATVAVALLVLGFFVFRRASPELVDAL